MARYSAPIDDQYMRPLAPLVAVIGSNGQNQNLTDDSGNSLSNPLQVGADAILTFNIPDPGDVCTLQYWIGGRLVREDSQIIGIPAVFVGPAGGNVGAIGTFQELATAPSFVIPAAAYRVTTSGYAAAGDGGYAGYAQDAAVTPSYVTAHPRAAAISQNGLGYRLDERILNPKMFGTATGSGWLAAKSWSEYTGIPIPFLGTVTNAPVPGVYNLPANFNDPIDGTTITYDGQIWKFTVSNYSKLDFTKWATATNYYLDYTQANDSGNGFTPATAKKSWDALLAVIGALAAGSYVIINCLNDTLGYLSMTALTYTQFNGKYVKVIGQGPSGRTINVSMRESYDVNAFAWVQHGSGAWKSNSAAAGNWAIQFYKGLTDSDGMYLPIMSAGQSAATVATTELTSFWDGTYLYVHLPNGAQPNPFVNWLYSNNAGEFLVKMDSGTVLFENFDFFHGYAGGPGRGIGLRSVSDANFLSTARGGFKNCHFYGASGNGFGGYDFTVMVDEGCISSYNFNDLFNVHSNQQTGTKGQYITYYSEGARGSHAGYQNWNLGLSPSNSDNGSTAHDGISVAVVGARFTNIKDCCFAYVGGADVAMYGCKSPMNNTGAASFYPSTICYEANTGEGRNRRLTMVGCSADYNGSVYAIQLSGSATDAQIIVQDWAGDPFARVTVFDSNVGANGPGAIVASNGSVLYKAV